jgi:antitoxin component YwqK of YwqJK toxin-antitoxin module
MRVDFINSKFDGNGKIYYENGNINYIGEFKDDNPHRKGKYYENGNIQYEGDFKNGKYDGNGKKYFEDGGYYIGEFKDGKLHGMGKLYENDGKIKYEGEFIDDVFQKELNCNIF